MSSLPITRRAGNPLTSKVEAVLKNNGDGYEAIVPMKYEDGSSYWVKLVSFLQMNT